MFWLRKCNLRTLKRYDIHPYQDGFVYSWKVWGDLLESVNKLKQGDIILNPYKGEWEEIDKIDYCWKPVCHKLKFNKDRYWNFLKSKECKWPKGKIVGHVITEFVITTKSQTYIYDIDHHDWDWEPPLNPEMLARFNKQISENKHEKN